MKTKIDGLLLLDKPVGISSNHALQRVKRLFNAQKAGHTGALDPLASGLLPICFGEATKFSQYLLDADKIYRVTAELGVRTTTSDAEGEIIDKQPVPPLTREQCDQLWDAFRGTTQQTPTMFSALKYQGKPLYFYARQGITVPRQARPITIHKLQLHSYHHRQMEFTVHCSKGTYIRTLVDDFGQLLGCGAHVTALRRLQVGHLPEQMVTISQLSDQPSPMALASWLLPVDCLLPAWPNFYCHSTQRLSLQQGKMLHGIDSFLPSGMIKLFDEDCRFFGVAEHSATGQLRPRRLLSHAAINQPSMRKACHVTRVDRSTDPNS